MANLTIFAALFAAMIAAASATTYTTVVTTTVASEENPRQESCQEEIEQKTMSHCREWMMEGRGSQFLGSVANPRYQEEHLTACCDQMKIISPMCRCDAIRKMMMDSQKEMEMQEMEKMMRKAESLPMMCHMDMPAECRMRAAFF